MSIDDEQELILEIQKEPKKFGFLFDLYYKQIFGYIFRRTMDYDLSRDIAAETFLKAFLNFGNYRFRGSPVSAWIYRIAGNEINQQFRKNKYQPESLNRLLEEDKIPLSFYGEEDERQKLEEELQRHEEYIQMQKAITQIGSSYQEVIALRFFENKSIREISEITGKNEGTIKSLLSRGIEKIKQRLK